MPFPALGGLAAKIAVPAFAKALPWKWIGAGVAVLLLALMVWQAIDAFGDALDARGAAEYERGKSENEARWQKANAKRADERLARFMANVDRRQAATEKYVADIAARKPEILRIDANVENFARAPAGVLPCLAPDAAGLWRASRAANGLQPGGADTRPAP
jgi:hypothetical protein